jgi:prolyl oligopeptidase
MFRRTLVSLGTFCIGGAVVVGCSTMTGSRSPAGGPDNHQWLEDIYGEAPLKWVKERNVKAENILVKDKRFAPTAAAARKIITAKDRIAMPSIAAGGKYRNFWQDEQHVRGLWRETTVSEYAKSSPKWKTLLDIDALNKKEGKSFVFAGVNCLAPDDNFCLVELSDGGKDAALIREYDVSKGEFVVGGFEVPAAKTNVSWIDKDTLLIGTDWGPGTLTSSGYARQARIWRRGQPLAQAQIVFEGKDSDVSVYAFKNTRSDSQNMFINRSPSFFEEENFLLTPDLKLVKLPLPLSTSFIGDFKNHLIFMLREDFVAPVVRKDSNSGMNRTYLSGTIVSLPVAALSTASPLSQLEKVYEFDEKSAYSGLSIAKDYMFLNMLRNVRGEILRVSRNEAAGEWEFAPIPFPNDGTPGIVDTDAFSNDFLIKYESFLQPTVLYSGNGDDLSKKLKKLKSLPHRFDNKPYVMEQFFATSKDGTKVPYFVVRKKAMKLNGKNPTLLYGYGGFEIALTPTYLGTVGKVWLEKGGVYVLANIRGGGEFGPRWHRAALKENRQRAYDDFAAIAEDLSARKITSADKLGIMGGSNGGLLVGVAATQRPELYKAVVCKAALLDMLRYHKLPPGASWMGEYGDPEIAAEAAYISKYSPYQNVREGVKYPKIFFYVSTADDRVQPGHARKMAARLEEVGADNIFFENTEGGHGGAADLEQRVKATALDYTYLYQQLM